MKKLIIVIFIISLFSLAYFKLTFFVIQPIGALPEGKTLLIWQKEKMNFIDSSDAICERETGKVNLFCRGIITANIVSKKEDIIIGFPYISFLYSISTNGREYSR